MLRYNLYLKDILEAINKIEKSLEGKEINKIQYDSEIWDATLMRLQIIGESIKKIPLPIKKKYSNVEWVKLERLRDVISHTYFKVNPLIIEDIIKNKIPSLKKEIRRILENEKK